MWYLGQLVMVTRVASDKVHFYLFPSHVSFDPIENLLLHRLVDLGKEKI